MPNRVFLDTNILVYSRDEASPFFDQVRQALEGLRANGAAFCIHRQVLREYACVATRPVPRGLGASSERALADIAEYEAAYRVVHDPVGVWGEWKRMVATGMCAGLRLHDAYIAAIMAGHRISAILTVNDTDFAGFEGIVPYVPSAWQSVLSS